MAAAAELLLPPLCCRCLGHAAAKLPPPRPRCHQATAAADKLPVAAELPPPPPCSRCHRHGRAAAKLPLLLPSFPPRLPSFPPWPSCLRSRGRAAAKLPPPRPRCHQAAVEIDRDLSRKCVGPLALARLYGESRIFTVNFVWYSLGRNDEGDSFEESIFCQIF